MKILLVVTFFIQNVVVNAQKQYNIGNESVFVPGQIVSTIQLLNYKNKQIGSRHSHTFFDSTKMVFTSVTTEGTIPYIIILQVITKSALKGLLADIEVKKSWINPEEKTKPANYWEVSVGFKKLNGTIAEIGATEYYKKEGTKVTIYKSTGTSYLVPFSSKKAADEFVKTIKNYLK